MAELNPEGLDIGDPTLQALLSEHKELLQKENLERYRLRDEAQEKGTCILYHTSDLFRELSQLELEKQRQIKYRCWDLGFDTCGHCKRFTSTSFCSDCQEFHSLLSSHAAKK